MNPPIIDILRAQRNDAFDALANVLAENVMLKAQIEALRAPKSEAEEKAA